MNRLTKAVNAAKLVNRIPAVTVSCNRGAHKAHPDWRFKIGTREVVGYGINGEPAYFDMPSVPMPPIRYKEEDDKIKALREKEKGDWSKLSIEEKKGLYRANFCQTFAEVNAPDNHWRAQFGVAFILMGLSMVCFTVMRTITNRDLPDTYSDERKEAQLRRILDLKINPIDGISSKWDYENDKWK